MAEVEATTHLCYAKNTQGIFLGRKQTPAAEVEATQHLYYGKTKLEQLWGRKEVPAAELEATTSLNLQYLEDDAKFHPD